VLSTDNKKGEYNQAGSFCQSKSVENLEISSFKGVLICIAIEGKVMQEKRAGIVETNKLFVFLIEKASGRDCCSCRRFLEEERAGKKKRRQR
jgi:hypothetical protein